MILEYKLHRTQARLVTTPLWVESGGYFRDPDTETYIGFSPAAANRNYKIPDDVVRPADNQAVKDRSQAIHAIYPYLKSDGTAFTNAEVDTLVDDTISDWDIA